MEKIKILFMGTPLLARSVLFSLLNNPHYEIVGVVTQEDKEVGRKKILTPSPVKLLALDHNLKVFQPHKIRLDYDFVKELKPDLIITCAYGQILPEELLKIPNIISLNVHGSLLPKYRGASPLQEALKNGDRVTGVTIMEMIKEMDAGKIFYQKEIAIDENDNYSSLMEKFIKIAPEALKECLDKIITKELKGIEQDESLVTFCSKIKKEDEHLNINLPKQQFINEVRSLSFVPGGYLILKNEIFKIFEAKIVNSTVYNEIGSIVKADKNGLYLQLCDGIVSLLKVQKQGKKMMLYRDFVNGEKDLLNQRLR